MSPKTSDSQRLRAAFQTLEGRAGDPAPCPSAEEIWQAAHGRPDPEVVATIVEHTVVCAECAEAWRLAAALEQPARRLLAMPERAAAPQRWLRRIAGVAAVAAVVAVGLSLLREPAPGYRSDPAQEIRSLLPEGATLPRERCLLRWSALPDAESYELEVTGEDLSPLLSRREIQRPEHLVPASALAALPDGARLYWRVTAVIRDGRRVASGTFSARIGISPREP